MLNVGTSICGVLIRNNFCKESLQKHDTVTKNGRSKDVYNIPVLVFTEEQSIFFRYSATFIKSTLDVNPVKLSSYFYNDDNLVSTRTGSEVCSLYLFHQ